MGCVVIELQTIVHACQEEMIQMCFRVNIGVSKLLQNSPKGSANMQGLVLRELRFRFVMAQRRERGRRNLTTNDRPDQSALCSNIFSFEN